MAATIATPDHIYLAQRLRRATPTACARRYPALERCRGRAQEPELLLPTHRSTSTPEASSTMTSSSTSSIRPWFGRCQTHSRLKILLIVERATGPRRPGSRWRGPDGLATWRAPTDQQVRRPRRGVRGPRRDPSRHRIHDQSCWMAFDVFLRGTTSTPAISKPI